MLPLNGLPCSTAELLRIIIIIMLLLIGHTISVPFDVIMSVHLPPLSSARQHPSYGDCLEVKREYYQNCSVLGCVTQCSQSAAHLYEQFLQV